jgi:hypothetical protein
LDRSHQHPLRIHLQLVDSWDIGFNHPIFHLLKEQAHRWNSLSLINYNIDITETVWRQIPNFPMLEELDLAGVNYDDLALFGNSPALRKLILAERCQIATQALPEAFQNVPELIFETPIGTHNLDVQINTSAKALTCFMSPEDKHEGSAFFFRQLRAPKLESLTLEGARKDIFWFALPFYLNILHPPLTSLKITPSEKVLYTDFRNNMIFTPHLKSLTLRCGCAMGPQPGDPLILSPLALHCLTFSRGRQSASTLAVVAPQLETLDLTVCEHFQHSDVLAVMVESRWRLTPEDEQVGRTRIVSVRLSVVAKRCRSPYHWKEVGERRPFRNVVAGDYYTRLKSCEEEGLELIGLD